MVWAKSPTGIEDVSFGPFSLIRQGEVLLRDGSLVKLGSRARHILAILVARAGEIVSKRELMDEVWPTTTVLEGNLTVHIAALRQALGETRNGPTYIVNVPGRGYRFVGEVNRSARPAARPDLGRKIASNLPLRLTTPIGRAEAILDVGSRLEKSNIVTICGPAGVGKTTLALSACEAASAGYRDGVWFIDLSPIHDEADVVTTVASVIPLELSPGDPIKAIVAALAEHETLFIIDNCEHLIDAVAVLVHAISTACPKVRILATSREALNVAGESICVLRPLECPPPTMLVGAQEALEYSAVQLLVERASASAAEFDFNDQNALSAALICRRLDGLPLAIEFAAALVGTFGLTGMVGRLDEHLRLLGIDRRGGAERHRTLEAALDWSYRLLDEGEQKVLRRLSVFAGGFTMEAAQEVVPLPGEQIDVGAILAGLTLKSLITSDITGPDLRFRVLETTRAFALTRLKETNELRGIAAKHARYYRDYLSTQHLTLERRDVAHDAIELDNIRAALRHSLGPDGDTDLALGLASGALPVWFGLSLLRECHARLKELRPRLTPEQRSTNEGWNVAVAIRTAEMFTRGTSRSTVTAWDRPPTDRGFSSNSLPSVADLLTNWTWNLRLPDYGEMMRLATMHAAIARESNTLHDRIMSAWVLGLSSHHIGDLVAARGHLAHFLAIETVEDRRIFVSHTGFDRTPGAQAMLAATLCQLGDVVEGLQQADLAEQTGRATGRSLPLCEALMWTSAARLIARAETGLLAETLDALVKPAEDHALDSHLGVILGLRGIFAQRQGAHIEAESFLARALSILDASNYGPFSPWFTGSLAVSLAHQSRHSEAAAVMDRFRANDINGDVWCTAEMLRLEASTLRLAGTDPEGVLLVLDKAIELSRNQASLAWEAVCEVDRHDLLKRQGASLDSQRLIKVRNRLSGRGLGALASIVESQLADLTSS